MAHWNGGTRQIPFGRSASNQYDDTTGLRWMFLLVVVTSLAFAHLASSSLRVELPRADRLASSLGYGEVRRVQHGYQPAEAPPSAAAATQPEAVSPSAAAQPEQAAPAAPPAPTLQPDPTAVPVNSSVRVANTDGLGVVLHTAPRRDARVPKGFVEGTQLTLLERQGDEWARVRGANGLEGWVSAQYLVPAN